MTTTQQSVLQSTALRFQSVDASIVLASASIESDADKLTLKSLAGGAVELKGVLSPTAPDSAANKAYVDALATGLKWLEPVATADLNWGLYPLIPGDIISSYTLLEGDRVLLVSQSEPVRNGIYIVPASGAVAPTRAADLFTGAQAAGVAVFVTDGDYASTGFVCSAPQSADTVDTDPLPFVQFSGTAPLTAGAGISIVGTTISVATGGVVNAMLADNAVTNVKIVDGAVTELKIVDGAVTELKLADNAVTTDKIADAAVTGAKISATIAGAKTFSDNLTCSGIITATSVTLSSDATLKENVSLISNASDVVLALQPVSYEFKASPGVRFGLIAQDVLQLLPDVVHSGDTLSVDYTSVFIMLLKSHQELSQRVAQLEASQ